MSHTEGRLGLYVFILVLNLVFPILGYTFTTFGTEFEKYDISLDPETLMLAGINLVDAESHNVTYNGDWVYFEIQNKTTRFRFMDDIEDALIFRLTSIGDGIAMQRQTAVSLALNNWLFPSLVSVKGINIGVFDLAMFNASIVAEWDTDFNWSRFVASDGTNIFVTAFSGSNITRSVYVDGTLNITIAETFEETTNFNFWQFLGWYSSLMLGTESWGLPSIFSWILKLFSALSILALMLLAKEMIRL